VLAAAGAAAWRVTATPCRCHYLYISLCVHASAARACWIFTLYTVYSTHLAAAGAWFSLSRGFGREGRGLGGGPVAPRSMLRFAAPAVGRAARRRRLRGAAWLLPGCRLQTLEEEEACFAAFCHTPSLPLFCLLCYMLLPTPSTLYHCHHLAALPLHRLSDMLARRQALDHACRTGVPAACTLRHSLFGMPCATHCLSEEEPVALRSACCGDAVAVRCAARWANAGRHEKACRRSALQRRQRRGGVGVEYMTFFTAAAFVTPSVFSYSACRGTVVGAIFSAMPRL